MDIVVGFGVGDYIREGLAEIWSSSVSIAIADDLLARRSPEQRRDGRAAAVLGYTCRAEVLLRPRRRARVRSVTSVATT